MFASTFAISYTGGTFRASERRVGLPGSEGFNAVGELAFSGCEMRTTPKNNDAQ
jgi:hypothetical protein